MLTTFMILMLYASSVIEFNNNLKPKKPKKQKSLQFNSLGLQVRADTVVNKEPFFVQRCDQIVLVKGEFIADSEDFTQRKEGFFTLTAYHTNLFKDKDANNLLQSILMSESKTFPQPIKGARGCIDIDGGKHVHSMLMCLPNEKVMNYILSALMTFRSCRGGDDQTRDKIPPGAIAQILKNCGINGKFVDPRKLLKKLQEKLKVKKDVLATSNKIWHPEGHNVPGT